MLHWMFFYASRLSVKQQSSFCCTLAPQFKQNDAVIEEVVEVMRVIKCLSFAPKPIFFPQRINYTVPIFLYFFFNKKKGCHYVLPRENRKSWEQYGLKVRATLWYHLQLGTRDQNVRSSSVSPAEILHGRLRRVVAFMGLLCLLLSHVAWQYGRWVCLLYGQLWQPCRHTLPLIQTSLQDLQSDWGPYFSMCPNSQKRLLRQDAQLEKC